MARSTRKPFVLWGAGGVASQKRDRLRANRMQRRRAAVLVAGAVMDSDDMILPLSYETRRGSRATWSGDGRPYYFVFPTTQIAESLSFGDVARAREWVRYHRQFERK